MGGKLQFLQAGALRLNDPLLGVPGIPASMQLRLEDARYEAARQLFEAALREDVEVVVLVGDTIGTSLPGSRAPWFLHQQFTRLAKRGIIVIVRGDDLPAAPNGLTWPANVYLVSAQCPVSVRTPGGETLCVCDDRGPLEIHHSAIHHIVLTGTPPSVSRRTSWPTAYWACNGDQQSLQSTLGQSEALAAGPLQGASFDTNGPCGVLLITLEMGRAIASQLILCDAVRWQTETLKLDLASTWDSVQRELSQRMEQLSNPAVLTIFHWRLAGEGPLFERLWSPRERQTLLAAVQRTEAKHTWISRMTATASAIVEFMGADTHALSIARGVAEELTAGKQLDLPTKCELTLDQTPADLRTLSRERYQQRLKAPLDQRLFNDLLWARSA